MHSNPKGAEKFALTKELPLFATYPTIGTSVFNVLRFKKSTGFKRRKNQSQPTLASAKGGLPLIGWCRRAKIPIAILPTERERHNAYLAELKPPWSCAAICRP